MLRVVRINSSPKAASNAAIGSLAIPPLRRTDATSPRGRKWRSMGTTTAGAATVGKTPGMIAGGVSKPVTTHAAVAAVD